MARKRAQITITPDPVVVDWVDARMGPGKRFYNRTHAFEYGIAKLMEEEANAKGGAGKMAPVDPDLAKAAHGFLEAESKDEPGSGGAESRRGKGKH